MKKSQVACLKITCSFLFIDILQHYSHYPGNKQSKCPLADERIKMMKAVPVHNVRPFNYKRD